MLWFEVHSNIIENIALVLLHTRHVAEAAFDVLHVSRQ